MKDSKTLKFVNETNALNERFVNSKNPLIFYPILNGFLKQKWNNSNLCLNFYLKIFSSYFLQMIDLLTTNY